MLVGELAAELGTSAGRVLDLCERLGISADGRSSRLNDADVRAVRSAVASAGTPREAGVGGPPTRREGGSGDEQGPGPTRREGAILGSGWTVQLPQELSGRFDLVRQLNHGGEGFVVLARARASGDEVVIKGYYQGLEVNTTSLDLLSRPDIDHDHVVRVHEYGTLPDGGFYEIQEYCRDGSLREHMAAGRTLDLDQVISELINAVAYVHRLPLIHRDLKPENILVRKVEPLDLVIADFGLIRQMSGSVRRTSRAGTVEYSAPEGVGSTVDYSPAWDWWAVGIIIAEVVTGSHPLALPDGAFPSADDIRSELAQRPVPLDGIEDERIRLLCSGLLVRDRRQRWATAEVQRWLAGEAPKVVDDAPSPASAATVTVLFAGKEHRTPAELAASFQSRWSEAMTVLFQDPDPSLLEETRALCRASGNLEAVTILGERPKGDDIIRHLARLLFELDPALKPEFDDLSVTPAGLEAAARRVTEDDDMAVADKLHQIERAQILRIWRHLPGMDDAASIYERWKDLHTKTTYPLSAATQDGLTLNSEERLRINALLLLFAIDSEHVADQRRALDEAQPHLARNLKWWRKLVEYDSAAAVALALVTLPRAQAQIAEAQEAERQREVKETSRLNAERAASERRAEVARREAEREASVGRQEEIERHDPVRFWISCLGVVLLAVAVASGLWGAEWLIDNPLGVDDCVAQDNRGEAVIECMSRASDDFPRRPISWVFSTTVDSWILWVIAGLTMAVLPWALRPRVQSDQSVD